MLSKLSSLPPLVKIGIAALVLLVAAAVVYALVGPLWALGVVAAGLLAALLWAVLALVVKAMKKKRAGDFDRQLSGGMVSKTEVDRAKRDLIDRWQSAGKVLQAAGLSMYDLPWFLLIGEPQSGKSTTLLNSGIEFPIGKESISGVGGTRNCDWWFANEAVILDTAGRFTFQERNAPDKDEWLTFLQLLRANRTACPINGVIVVIPVTSLQEDSREVLEEKAANIRNKLENIQKILEIQFPVFLLITKADHVLGFTEFCGRLPVDAQRQLVGWSETRPFDQPYNPAAFRGTYEATRDRLHKWRVKFLGEELSTSEADKLFAFPEEFGALAGPLEEYLRVIFQTSKYAKPLFFRGYYFTSGMQQGRPVAKACAAMLGAEGTRSEAIESLESSFAKHRAFFIRDFYREKLFPEQGLVFRTPEALARDRKLRIATWVGGTVLTLASIAFLVTGLIRYNRALDPVRQTTERVESLMTGGEELEIDEALAVTREVTRRAQELRQQGATAAFFRGKNNVVSDDLHRIHRSVFARKVLAPLLARTGRLLATPPAEGSAGSELYLDALQQYIRLLALAGTQEDVRQTKLARLDMGTLAEFYLAARDDQAGFSADEIVAEYERFVEEGGRVPDLPEGSLDLAGAIDALESYWPVSAELAPYRKLKELTESLDATYRRLFKRRGAVAAVDYEPIGEDTRALIDQLDQVKAQVDAINKSGFLLTGTITFYSKLQAEIDDGTAERQRFIEQLGAQSERVASDTDKTLAKPLERYEHLVLLGPKASAAGSGGARDAAADAASGKPKNAGKDAAKALKGAIAGAIRGDDSGGTRIAAVTPLLTGVEKALAGVKGFYERVAASDAELTETLTRLSARKARDQAHALKSHHDGVRGRMEEIAAQTKEAEIPGGIPPWDGRTLGERLPDLLRAGYVRYLELSYPHWLQVYGAFPIEEAPGNPSDWRSFSNLPVFLRGQGAYQLYDPVTELIDTLAQTVPPEMGETVPEAAPFVEHLAWLETNKQRIVADTEAFVAAVWNLDDDPVKAWQQLHDTDPKGETSFANLRALDALEKEIGGRFGGERVLRTLAGWSDRAEHVLFADVEERLNKDWAAMRKTYARDMADKFPFGGEIVPEDTEGTLKRYKIAAAGIAELRDFLTGREGIGAIISDYRLGTYLAKGEPLPRILDATQKEFVVLCHDWQMFLFDQDVARPQTIQVEYEPHLDTAPNVAAPIGRRYTELRMSGPGAFDVTFRPSSDRARAKEVIWKPEAADRKASLKIRGTNEDSGDQGAYYLEGGPLSVLAYVIKSGTPERGRDRKSWIVRVDVPDPENPKELLSANVRFRFDRVVPGKK